MLIMMLTMMTMKGTQLDINFQAIHELSHEKRTALLSIESCLFHEDPYNGLWNNPHITG